MKFLYTNIYGLLRTLRPRQWVKNGLIFMALVFDQKLTVWPLLLRTTLAFILFCMISSTVYIINDLVDIEKDRQHPKKRNRALPLGQIAFHLTQLGFQGHFLGKKQRHLGPSLGQSIFGFLPLACLPLIDHIQANRGDNKEPDCQSYPGCSA